MRAWVKEIALTILVEQEEIRAFGEVRSFLGLCQAKGIRLRVDRQGKLWIEPKDKLGPGMKAAFIRLRERIIAHLENIRDSMERDTRRAQEAWNKQHPAVAGKGGT
jgi:hypothetical protein